MASILSFMPRGDFDDADTKALGDAFDGACAALHDTGQPALVHEIIARRIIVAARKGERDVKRLRQDALAALANRGAPPSTVPIERQAKNAVKIFPLNSTVR